MEQTERSKYLEYSTTVVGFLFSAFYLYETIFGVYSTSSHRGMYFLFTGVMIFLVYQGWGKGEKKKLNLYDLLLILATIVITIGWMYSYVHRYKYRFGMMNEWDLVINAGLFLLCFEMARRVLGKSLPLLALFLTLYCYFGRFIPGYWGHKGFTAKRIIEFMGTMNAIMGVAIHAYATYVFLFIVFAAFLKETGLGSYIIEFAKSVGGRYRGGEAKVAVISSGIIGSIMGSGIANISTTGSFTIPMMKAKGYEPHVAGAIEAVASSGGQFLPPVMGAAAFLIAAFTETPYVVLIKMAAIPAVLYFFSVLFVVHFEAVKRGIKRLPKEEIPPLKGAALKGALVLFPLAVIIVVLVAGYSPNLAAVCAIASVLLLGLVKKDLRITPRGFISAMVDGAKNSLMVGATGGVIGIIVGAVTLSGLSTKVSDAIIALTGGSLFLAILLTGLTCYLLGMSMTVVADYVVVSVVAVPALSALGVPIVAAHLMVFWFVLTSGITPPVCIGAFAAAGIAKADPMKTGFTALKMALALYITPFIFVYTPKILYGTFMQKMMVGISAACGFLALAIVVEGAFLRRISMLERLFLAFASFCLFHPSFYLDLLGYGILLFFIIIHWIREKGKVLDATI